MTLGREFWNAAPLAPIPLLAELRTHVLERSHTRCPRWHFRVASDLVLRIQPRPGERRDRFWAFAGVAFFGEGATRALCDKPPSSFGWLGFGITTAEAGWSFLPRGCTVRTTRRERDSPRRRRR